MSRRSLMLANAKSPAVQVQNPPVGLSILTNSGYMMLEDYIATGMIAEEEDVLCIRIARHGFIFPVYADLFLHMPVIWGESVLYPNVSDNLNALDGYDNTEAIIAYNPNIETAARNCRNHTFSRTGKGGYLGSTGEFSILNRYFQTIEFFWEQQEIVVDNMFIWTSTQQDTFSAFCHQLGSSRLSVYKNAPHYYIPFGEMPWIESDGVTKFIKTVNIEIVSGASIMADNTYDFFAKATKEGAATAELGFSVYPADADVEKIEWVQTDNYNSGTIDSNGLVQFNSDNGGTILFELHVTESNTLNVIKCIGKIYSIAD